MNSVGSVATIVVLLVIIGIPLVLIAAMVMLLRRGGTGRLEFDFGTIYYHLVAFITLLIAGGALFSAVYSILNLALGTWMPDPALQPVLPPGVEKPVPIVPPQDIWVKEQIASSAALFLVATPVWLYHWVRARKNVGASKGLFIHKLYLYLVVVVALIAFLVSGGALLSKLIGLLLGIVDWSSEYSRNSFYRDTISALFQMFVAGTVWLYHWRAVNTLPTEADTDQEIKTE